MTHTRARAEGLLWTRDRTAAETSNIQHFQKTDVHAPGGIQTRNASKQAATYTRLKTRGHWNLLIKVKEL
jgi:hypothetical protein